MLIRPMNDWVLVHMEPIRETTGTIIQVHGERVRRGLVLARGPGRYEKGNLERTPTGVEPGDRVVFFRENLEHQPGKAIMHVMQEMGDDVGLIRASDILLVLMGDVEVTV